MVRAAGLELGSRRGRWRFSFVALADGALHRVDAIVADAVWQETLSIAARSVDVLHVGPVPDEHQPQARWLFDEAIQVIEATDTPCHAEDPEDAYTRLAMRLHGTAPDLPSRDSLEGFQARMDLLHAAGLRPARIYGGIGLIEPNDVLDATVLAWAANDLFAPR